MGNPIVLYDIPTVLPKYKALSSNTWRVRFALAYKGLPFRTEWVDWADIETVCKNIGAEPTGNKATGSPFYTLPVIHDPSTGQVLSDSLKIILYLDQTYPNTPRLLQPGTEPFQAVFASTVFMTLTRAMYPLFIHRTVNSFSPESAEVYRKTRAENLGEEFRIAEDMTRDPDAVVEQWKKIQAGFDLVSSWCDVGHRDINGPFITGDTPTYGDVVIASGLVWVKIVAGEESEEWKKIKGWNGGRWGRLSEAFEKYEILN